MTIAIDADDMEMLRKRLRGASEDVSGATPTLPGNAAFGPAVLGAAVASFDAAMRRQAQDVAERWDALSSGVSETYADMSKVEAGIISALSRTHGIPE